MKLILSLMIFFSCASFQVSNEDKCSTSVVDFPRRLVSIRGKATIVNFPGGPLPATSETLIFQKVGCDCYVAAGVDLNGMYEVLVGDGKYRIIVRNPSSPEVDWLAPDQKRIVDTREDSSNGVVNFYIKIKMPNQSQP